MNKIIVMRKKTEKILFYLYFIYFVVKVQVK